MRSLLRRPTVVAVRYLLALSLVACASPSTEEGVKASTSTLVEDWARTHCERRWSECPMYPSDHRAAYVESCVAVVMVRTCEAILVDDELAWDCPAPRASYDACMDEIAAAECASFTEPFPSCNPFVD